MTAQTDDTTLRDLLDRLLAWEDAHVGLDTALADIPGETRGRRPDGLPHSPWEIVEHLRRAQHDILSFCVSDTYTAHTWPDDYWPPSPAPPSATAWDDSVAQFRRDREALQGLATDPSTDLGAPVPNGTGQTLLRELLLTADHTAYHVGELVVVLRLLGVWRAAR